MASESTTSFVEPTDLVVEHEPMADDVQQKKTLSLVASNEASTPLAAILSISIAMPLDGAGSRSEKPMTNSLGGKHEMMFDVRWNVQESVNDSSASKRRTASTVCSGCIASSPSLI